MLKKIAFVLFAVGVLTLTAPSKAQSPQINEEFATLQPDYEGSEALYQEWKAEKGDNCSCVLFAKRLTGFNESVGYAKNWPKNSDKPVVGGVVITSESSSNSFRTGHVAYISKIDGEQMTLIEGNYIRCKKSTRIMSVKDKKITGFWSWTISKTN